MELLYRLYEQATGKAVRILTTSYFGTKTVMYDSDFLQWLGFHLLNNTDDRKTLEGYLNELSKKGEKHEN